MLRLVMARGPMLAASFSLVFHRSCLDLVGEYDETLRYTQDTDMPMRLARACPLLHVPEPLVFVRRRPQRGQELHTSGLDPIP